MNKCIVDDLSDWPNIFFALYKHVFVYQIKLDPPQHEIFLLHFRVMSTTQSVSWLISWCALTKKSSTNAWIKQIQLVSRYLIELLWKYEEVLHPQHHSRVIKYTLKCSFRWSLWQEPSESRSVRVSFHWFFVRIVRKVRSVNKSMRLYIYSKLLVALFLSSQVENISIMLPVTAMHVSCHSHLMLFCLVDSCNVQVL